MQNKTTSCVYTNKIAKRQQIIAEIAYIRKFMLLLCSDDKQNNNVMKKVNLIMAGFFTLTLLACGESESPVGKWVQPVPNMSQMEQGFILEEGGKASSVNMATLSYERWEKQNDRLILSGKSIGNHQTIIFSDTFAIEKLTQDSLVLRKRELRLGYGRENDMENEALPKTVEGILNIGHEVRSLTIQGDTNDYWIKDKTGVLFQQYDSITQGVKNGQPVYAKLQIIDAGRSEEGFAKNYDKVLEVVGIDSLVSYSRDLQLFRESIRTESVSGEKNSCYILFSRDSLYACLYKSCSEEKERLQRRTLPNGKHVWNIEDDDTKNLNFSDGCWTVSQRDKILFKQSPSDNNRELGNWVEEHYTGVLPAADCAGIDYQLYVRHREYSGDGQFLLQLTYMGADNGKDAIYTYMGKRFTLRGIPANNDATVWQLVSDNGENTFNFLYGTDGLTLTLLNNRFETPKSELDYSLKKAG